MTTQTQELVQKIKKGEIKDLKLNDLDYESLEYILKHLRKTPNENIKNITVTEPNLEDHYKQLIFDFIEALKHLEKIELSNIGLTDSDIVDLMQKIKSHESIKTLILNENRFNEKGAMHIANFLLEGNKKLTKLEISKNSINSNGAISIAHSLKGNQTLTELNLNGCYIKDIGLDELSKILKTNCSIARLDLGSNFLSEKSATNLAETINANSKIKLTSVNLSSNHITSEGLQVIKKMLPSNYLIEADLNPGEYSPNLLKISLTGSTIEAHE